MYKSTDLTEEKYEEILEAAVDWQYIVVLGGGMARKSDCEAWLMKHYPIDHSTARNITNEITEIDRSFTISPEGVFWHERIAGRPAPHPWQYPDIEFEVIRPSKKGL